MQEAANYGALDFLSKPNLDGLEEVVKRVLTRTGEKMETVFPMKGPSAGFLCQLRILIEMAFDSSWIVSIPDFHLEFGNAKPTEKMLGYKMEAYLRDKNFWFSIIHPEDKSLALQLNTECLRQGEAEGTYRMLHQDGYYLWIKLRQKILTNDEGKVHFVLRECTDVTSLHLSKQRLVEAGTKFDSFFTLTLELLSISRMDGYFDQLNPAFLNCLGYNTEELISRPFITLVHPDDVAATLAEMEKLKSGAVTLDFENRYRCKDGSYKIISWRSVPSAENGLLYSSSRDVTEERRRMNILQRSNELLEDTQAITHVGGWEIDLANKTLYWTKETYNIHELDPATYTPDIETAINFYAPECIPLIQAAVQKAIEGGDSFDLELEIITAKQRRVPVRSMGKPHFEDGKLTRLTGIFHDLTEVKKVEALLQEQKKALISSAKMSSLGEMSAAIAHEINNPLAIIDGCLMIIKSIMAKDPLDKEFLKEQVSAIQVTSNRIVKIIRGLQLFTRNSEKELVSDTSMDKIVEETLVFCQQRFKNAGIDLQVMMKDVEGVIFPCKATQLSQVILNLLNNAFDAIRPLDRKWIEIRGQVNEGWIVVTVTDSGTGIGDHIVTKIMEPFFTTKEPGAGTGLGLSISKGIIEMHGGRLFYDPKCVNTRFTFEIPLHPPEKTSANES